MCIKRSFKCFFSCVITCVVLLLVFPITALVLMNQTPEKLKFGDKKLIGDKSLADMGLSNLKLKDLTQGLVNLREFDENDFIVNTYNTNAEAQIAKENIKQSSLDSLNVNFASVLTDKVTYDNAYMLTYKDTTLAFILNSALNTTSQTNSREIPLKGIHVKELSITNNSVPHAKILLSFPSFEDSSFKDSKVFGGFANSPLITLEFDFSVSAEGSVSIAENGENKAISCLINDGDKMITAYFNHLIKGQNMVIDEISDIVSDSFVHLLNNLGQIGKADVLDNNVVQGTAYFGSDAISNGKITIITYIAE